MPRPHSLRDYLSTRSISTSPDGGTGLSHDIYRLEWAKEQLDIPHIDNEQDVRLLLAIKTAQSIIEDKTNLSFAPVDVVLEYTNPTGKLTPVLELPGSDFAEVQEIEEYRGDDASVIYELDADGDPTPASIGLDEIRMRKRLYLRRQDGKDWPVAFGRERLNGVVVVVKAERRVFDVNHRNMIRAAMDMLVVELDESRPASGQPVADSQQFLRLIESLKSATPTPGFS